MQDEGYEEGSDLAPDEIVAALSLFVEEQNYMRPLNERDIHRFNRELDGPSLLEIQTAFPSEPGGPTSTEQCIAAVNESLKYSEPPIGSAPTSPIAKSVSKPLDPLNCDSGTKIPGGTTPKADSKLPDTKASTDRKRSPARRSRKLPERLLSRLEAHPTLRGWTEHRAVRAISESAQILGLEDVPSYDKFDEISSFFAYPRPRYLATLAEGGYSTLRHKAARHSNLKAEAPSIWTKASMLEAGARVIKEDGITTLFSRQMIREYSRPGKMPAVNTIISAWADQDGRNGLLNYNLELQKDFDIPLPPGSRWSAPNQETGLC